MRECFMCAYLLSLFKCEHLSSSSDLNRNALCLINISNYLTSIYISVSHLV